jgi:general L-amino acid transport system substrate-binding protein
VRAAGVLRCGSDVEEAEYSTTDDHGNRSAFDADLCRAVAVAVLGENARVSVAHYPDDRAAMQGLSERARWRWWPRLTDDFTHSVDTHLNSRGRCCGTAWAFLCCGQQFRNAGAAVEREEDLFSGRDHGGRERPRLVFAPRACLEFVPFPFQEEGEMQAAFATGNCGALAGDRTRLAETRAALAQRGHRSRLLPKPSLKTRWPRRCAQAIRSGRRLSIG